MVIPLAPGHGVVAAQSVDDIVAIVAGYTVAVLGSLHIGVV